MEEDEQKQICGQLSAMDALLKPRTRSQDPQFPHAFINSQWDV